MGAATRRGMMAAGGAAAVLAACESRAASPPPSARWRARAPAPYAVQEIYSTLHEGRIWIAGGFTAQGATARVVAYDPAADAWSEGPSLPDGRHHVHLVSAAGVLWAIGGFLGGESGGAWTCTADTFRLEEGVWRPGPALPKPIGEAVPLELANRIHLVGGRSPKGEKNAEWADQGDVGDHFVLAPGAPAWESAAPLPIPRNSAAGAVVDGALAIVSGRTVSGGAVAAVHRYDPRADAWRDGPAYPEPMGGLAAAVHEGRLVAGGGEVFKPNAVSDALFALGDRGWERIDTLPRPRHGHGFVAAGGALHVLGGAVKAGGGSAIADLDVRV